MQKGPIADEPVMGTMVRWSMQNFTKMRFTEDTQNNPAVRNAIKGAMLRARTVLMEPMQRTRFCTK